MNNASVVAVSCFRAAPNMGRAHKPALVFAIAALASCVVWAAVVVRDPLPGPRLPSVLPAVMPGPERANPQPLQAASPESRVATEMFPASRVRLNRAPDHAPEPFYVANRVILREVTVASDSTGMDISGGVFVDFDCDCPPGESGLPKGQIEGLLIEVSLLDRTPLLQLDKHGKVELPAPNIKQPGRLVAGQTVQTRTQGTQEGFGQANFTLPRLDKPLAPGIYDLLATLTFKAQGRTQQEQLKWCSGFWGAEDGGLVDGKRVVRPVLGNNALHQRHWTDLLEVTRHVQGGATLFVGDTLAKGKVALRGAAASNDRYPPNLVIWNQHLAIVEDLERYHTQKAQSLVDEAGRLNNPDLMDAKLAAMRQVNPKATMADAVAAVKAEGKAERKLVDDLVTQAGGPATVAESKLLASSIVARGTVLQAQFAFQDRLKYLLWVAMDGVMFYTGFQSLDQPGRLAWHAIDKNDAATARTARIDRQKKTDAAALAARDEAGKLQPPDIWKAYTAYLKQRDDTPDFDPANFTVKQEGRLVLKVEAWTAWRETRAKALAVALDPLLAELDTSTGYANRLMPEAVGELLAAREQLACLGLAYEYSIRVNLMKEDAGAIGTEWQKAAADDKDLARLMGFSRTDRNMIKSRYDAHIATARKLAAVEEFRARWGAALKAGQPLPGTRTH